MPSVPPPELEDFTTIVLTASGADANEAAGVARALVWAEQRGRPPQGVIWTRVLSRRLIAGTLVSPAVVEWTEAGPTGVVGDAGGGFGHTVTEAAVDRVAERASGVGTAWAAIRNSHHFGAAGRYVAMLADRGFVGLAATNAYPKVAAPGARRAALGTNPMAFGAPIAGEDPLVVDMSAGAIAGSRVREASALGVDLPDGVALDAQGAPTTDPGALSNGGVMLPVGGAKGFGLGLMVEVLTSGLSAGATPGDLGSMFGDSRTGTSHFVMAIDGGVELAGRIAAIAADVRSDVGGRVRLPGHSPDRLAPAEPIALTPESQQALADAARAAGIEPPDWCDHEETDQ